MQATQSFIVAEGLNQDEKQKLNRIDERLVKVFGDNGFMVRLCRPELRKGIRTIFFDDFNSPRPVLSISSAKFLSIPDEELLASMSDRLAQI